MSRISAAFRRFHRVWPRTCSMRVFSAVRCAIFATSFNVVFSGTFLPAGSPPFPPGIVACSFGGIRRTDSLRVPPRAGSVSWESFGMALYCPVFLFSLEFGDQLEIVAEDDEPLHVVLEFPHVPRPGVIKKQFDQFRRQPHRFPVVHPGVSAEKIVRDQRDVLFPLPKRRHDDVHHVDPVEQVAAELPLLDHPFQVLVGGAQDAAVRLHLALAADAEELLLLQDVEQFRLQVQVHLADLVEEDGAALRHLEAAVLAAVGAGERPLLEAEQLALEQLPRQGGAVDLDERLVRPSGRLVKSLGDQFLAGAAFPR